MGLALWPLETGFDAPGMTVITEQDIFAPGLRGHQANAADQTIFCVRCPLKLAIWWCAEHGIGRFDGLEIIQSAGGDHECLRLLYADGDRLPAGREY